MVGLKNSRGDTLLVKHESRPFAFGLDILGNLVIYILPKAEVLFGGQTVEVLSKGEAKTLFRSIYHKGTALKGGTQFDISGYYGSYKFLKIDYDNAGNLMGRLFIDTIALNNKEPNKKFVLLDVMQVWMLKTFREKNRKKLREEREVRFGKSIRSI